MIRTLFICAVLIPTAASAQLFAGDSLRVRTFDRGWTYGRVLTQDGGTQLTLRAGTDTLRLSFANLQRVDRWKRNNPSLILITSSVGFLAATFAYNQTPPQDRGISQTKAQIIGAGAGAAMGLVGFAVWPGQWKVMIDR